MPSPQAASEVLERDFLGIRARLIDVAAALDRITRAGGSAVDDPRLPRIRRSLEMLASQRTDRAEQLQMIFSLPYQHDWQEQLGLEKPP